MSDKTSIATFTFKTEDAALDAAAVARMTPYTSTRSGNSVLVAATDAGYSTLACWGMMNLANVLTVSGEILR